MSEPASNFSKAGAEVRNSSAELLSQVYSELRKLAFLRLAQERPGQSLQATVLVHEAWLRIVSSHERSWESRTDFFFAAAPPWVADRLVSSTKPAVVSRLIERAVNGDNEEFSPPERQRLKLTTMSFDFHQSKQVHPEMVGKDNLAPYSTMTVWISIADESMSRRRIATGDHQANRAVPSNPQTTGKNL